MYAKMQVTEVQISDFLLYNTEIGGCCEPLLCGGHLYINDHISIGRDLEWYTMYMLPFSKT